MMTSKSLAPWAKTWLRNTTANIDAIRMERGWAYFNFRNASIDVVHRGAAGASIASNSGKIAHQQIIRFPPLHKTAGEYVAEYLSKNPQARRQLASGQMPEDFLDNLDQGGITLMVRPYPAMQSCCTCNDAHPPCKHVAAAFITLAHYLNDRPLLLLLVRGIDIRPIRRIMAPEAEQLAQLQPPDDSPGSPADPGLFWAPAVVVALPEIRAPHLPLPVISRLGDFPNWDSPHPFEDLQKRIAQHATQRVLQL